MAKKVIATKGKVVATEVAVEEVKTGGLTFDDGIVLTTFFIVAGALALVLMASQKFATG